MVIPPEKTTTKRRHQRKLRMCGDFQRGKCAICNQPMSDGHECDMKKSKGAPSDNPDR